MKIAKILVKKEETDEEFKQKEIIEFPFNDSNREILSEVWSSFYWQNYRILNKWRKLLYNYYETKGLDSENNPITIRVIIESLCR